MCVCVCVCVCTHTHTGAGAEGVPLDKATLCYSLQKGMVVTSMCAIADQLLLATERYVCFFNLDSDSLLSVVLACNNTPPEMREYVVRCCRETRDMASLSMLTYLYVAVKSHDAALA